MLASLSDVILPSFRADAESLRDLDSIIKQDSSEINPAYSISYEVHRKDSLRFETADVEELIKERNGNETRIERVRIKVGAESSPKLEFKVIFADHLRIEGECDDRAKLVLLASDVRTLVRERMKSRSLSNSTRVFAASVAALIAVVGYLAFSVFMSAHYTQNANDALNRYYQIGNRQALAYATTEQQLLDKYSGIVYNNNITSGISFLVQSQVSQIRHDIAASNGAGNSPPSPANPWWLYSIPIFLGLGSACAALVLGVSYIIYPTSKAIFIIGDEIRRQARLAIIRERLIWGIGVTFLLGVASAIVVSAAHI